MVQPFVVNLQQLIAPKELRGEMATTGVQATQRRIRRFEEIADNLYEDCSNVLVVIADESHLYGSQAKAFHQALRDALTLLVTKQAAYRAHASATSGAMTLNAAVQDASVAATMLVHGIDTIVIRNVGDFRRFSGHLRVLDLVP